MIWLKNQVAYVDDFSTSEFSSLLCQLYSKWGVVLNVQTKA